MQSTSLENSVLINETDQGLSGCLPKITPDMLLGTVQDLTRSKPFHKLINQQAPDGVLEHATLEFIEYLENNLDQQLVLPFGNHIHIGRGRFEYVSSNEADLFRTERKLASQHKKSSKIQAKFADCIVFGGRSNPNLFDDVIQKSGATHGKVTFGTFASGEPEITINTSVRGCRVFVMQAAADPVNDNSTELELIVDALKRASALEINVVATMYPYARQDRKGRKRSPISAAAFANRLKSAGADRVITLDIHSPQIEGFFQGPFDNLDAGPVIVPELLKKYGDQPLMVVAADEGQMKRLDPVLDAFRNCYQGDADLDLAQATMKKHRDRPNEIEHMDFIGNPALVKDRVVFLWDDMIDTGGTIVSAAKILRDYQPAQVVVVATHGIFSFQGVEKLRNAEFFDSSKQESKNLIDQLVITDSLPLKRGKGDFITVVSVSNLLAEAIERICRGKGESLNSLSNLFH